MTDKLFCPVCKSELSVTHQERYQSLTEHVCDPNGEPSLKDGYQCPDSKCVSNLVGATWTVDGDIYTNTPSNIGFIEAHDLMEKSCIDNINTAIGSWQRSYDMTLKKKKKYTLNVNLYWIMIRFEPEFHQIFDEIAINEKDPKVIKEYESKEKYRWKFAGFSTMWFKRDSKGCYFSFSPIWTIVKYKNDIFKQNYHKALQRDKNAMKELMKIYNDSSWHDDIKEDRFGYLLANKIIRLWHRKEFILLKNIVL